MRSLEEEPGGGTWVRSLEEEPGEEPGGGARGGAWRRSLEEELGRETWRRSLGEDPGGGAWGKTLEEEPAGGDWRRSLCMAIRLHPLTMVSAIYLCTTFSDGCLGSNNDEGRNDMR